ncbi:MAG TPA: hypothetical protein VKU44_11940 [Terriglobia bacterium]|nr:hypothetical protein [Terriglobia bacterium]
MAEADAVSTTSIKRMIVEPALITLALTLLRLEGELAHWLPNTTWFSTAPGGPGPLAAAMALLPPVFGGYFALRLARLGNGPVNARSAVGYGVLGAFILLYCVYFLLGDRSTFDVVLGYMLVILAAVLQFSAWPRFAATLLAYAYAARVPVVMVMLLARAGHWGTHFETLPPGHPDSGFVGFALSTQLIFWVAYTIVAGALLGSIGAAFVDRGTPQT